MIGLSVDCRKNCSAAKQFRTQLFVRELTQGTSVADCQCRPGSRRLPRRHADRLNP